MKYTVRGRKKHVVELPRKADFFEETEVKIGDETLVLRILERTASGNPRLVSVNGRILPVQVERRSDGFPAKVLINGLAYPVELEKVESTRFRPPAAAKQVSGEIRAELPGTVATVLVSQGANVKKGQALMILEAMKMENEILAPRDGVLKILAISPGQAVLKGDMLAEIA